MPATGVASPGTESWPAGNSCPPGPEPGSRFQFCSIGRCRQRCSARQLPSSSAQTGRREEGEARSPLIRGAMRSRAGLTSASTSIPHLQTCTSPGHDPGGPKLMRTCPGEPEPGAGGGGLNQGPHLSGQQGPGGIWRELPHQVCDPAGSSCLSQAGVTSPSIDWGGVGCLRRSAPPALSPTSGGSQGAGIWAIKHGGRSPACTLSSTGAKPGPPSSKGPGLWGSRSWDVAGAEGAHNHPPAPGHLPPRGSRTQEQLRPTLFWARTGSRQGGGGLVNRKAPWGTWCRAPRTLGISLWLVARR